MEISVVAFTRNTPAVQSGSETSLSLAKSLQGMERNTKSRRRKELPWARYKDFKGKIERLINSSY